MDGSDPTRRPKNIGLAYIRVISRFYTHICKHFDYRREYHLGSVVCFWAGRIQYVVEVYAAPVATFPDPGFLVLENMSLVHLEKSKRLARARQHKSPTDMGATVGPLILIKSF